MWRLEHPEYLFALILPVALWTGFLLAQRAKGRALARMGRPDLLLSMMKGYSAHRERIRTGLLIGATAMLALALANPQAGSQSETVKQRSLDVIVALDISLSMLAEDVPPNRLERAKQFARELVSALRNERVGLVLLAGNAYPQIPLTTDFAAVEMALRSAHPGLAPTPGTAIGEAVEVAEKLFGPERPAGKVLILISDGETHDSDALARAEAAGKNKVVIFSLGIGSAEGGFIPVQIAGRSDYKRDERGEPVRSRLHEDFLQKIAAAGNGRYFRIQSSNHEAAIKAIRSRIDTLEKEAMEQRRFDRYTSFFQVFLAAGLVLLLWAARLELRSRSLSARNAFGKLLELHDMHQKR